MTERPNYLLQFWCAATFIRRAPERDGSRAKQILANVATNASGKVQARAANLLREINEPESARPQI